MKMVQLFVFCALGQRFDAVAHAHHLCSVGAHLPLRSTTALALQGPGEFDHAWGRARGRGRGEEGVRGVGGGRGGEEGQG